MLNPTRFRAIARKELIQLRRDPRSLALAFALPVLLLVIFGYAITWDVSDIRTAIVDQSNTARSRALIDAFRASQSFAVVARPRSSREATALIDRAAVRLAIVIPPAFARDLDGGRTASVQAIVDGTDANTATIALAYADAVVASAGAKTVLDGQRIVPAVTAQSRIWYNEDLQSRNMIVPGLIAVIMMIIAAMLTSLTLAREWERGTMEQLAATPVSRLEVVLGKLLPYLAIGIVDVLVASLVGVTLFGVPFRGSTLLLAVLTVAFLFGSLGLGIWISAVARSQLLATQMAMLVTFMPALLLSGFMFSIDVMPAPLQVLTLAVPARYFLVVTRGIFLKGIGVRELWLQGALMIGFAIIGLSLAVRAFKKELA